MLKAYPRYHDLLTKRGLVLGERPLAEALRRFKAQDYRDLQVWCNLAWCDPWWLQRDPVLRRLVEQGGQFTEADKQRCFERTRAILADVLPTYRAFRERGHIEVSVSPYYHPILPLLCDVRAARAALPTVPLPRGMDRYPAEARWHVTAAARRYAEIFGAPPQGLWPSEGSVSDEMAALVMEAGFRWMATDEEILWRSLRQAPSAQRRYRPQQLRRGERSLAVFFRDRTLSDLVGFTYSQMDARAAVDDFMQRLAAIHQDVAAHPQPSVVSIMLDGENAWEYYAHDGQDFLVELYGRLSRDARFRCVTMSEWLSQHPPTEDESIPQLFPGSWIGGHFGTWVGHREKNQAWECVVAAYDWLRAYEREHPEAQGTPPLERAWRCLRIAEGSDWNWWYGDDHSSSQDLTFDALFRLHVGNVYRSLGVSPPEALATPIKNANVVPQHEPVGWLAPVIDGRETDYYEWRPAGWVDFTTGHGAMQPGAGILQRLGFGFDAHHLFLRVDFHWPDQTPQDASWRLRVVIQPAPGSIELILRPGLTEIPCDAAASSATWLAAYDKILEVRVPLQATQASSGSPLSVQLTLLREGVEVEMQPQRGPVVIRLPTTEDAARQWMA